MAVYLIINGRFSSPDETTRDAVRLAIESRSKTSDESVFREPVEAVFEPTDAWLEEHVESVVAVCGGLPRTFIGRATALRWVQLQGAGAEGPLRAYAEKPEVIITNASGIHGIPISEHLLAMIFAFARRLPHWFALKGSRSWDRSAGDSTYEVAGKHVLIVGYGAIGEAFGERVTALGMTVTAIRRGRSSRESKGEPGDSAEPAVEVLGPEKLRDELGRADFIANILPHTSATHHLFGEKEFSTMKPSAVFLNVGRGKTVDEAALIRALESGTIAGAGLDVVEEEPLEPDSPLWAMEQVIITPHISGLTPEYDRRLLEIFLGNLDRFLGGEELENVVDREAGY